MKAEHQGQVEIYMALGPQPESAEVMESVPSLPIHSSLLFVLIAGLFLAALIIRAQRRSLRPRHTAGLTKRRARTARRHVQRRRRRRSRVREGPDHHEQLHNTHGAEVTTLAREGTMRQNMQQATVSPEAGAHQRSAPAGQFRIHWDRTIFAAIAALGLVASLGTALAAWVGPLSWSVPGICVVVVLLSLVALQVSAALRRRRKRRARVEHAIQDAMNSQPQVREETALRQRSAAEADASLGITSEPAPFDALSADSAGHGGPDSLVTVDEDGLPQDADRLFGERAPQAEQPAAEESALLDQGSSGQSTAATAESWTPRAVPHPKYLVAEKVERSEPEPLVAPQEPAPSADTKLKQPAAPAAPAAAQSEESESSGPEESMDLDAVLKRRRA